LGTAIGSLGNALVLASGFDGRVGGLRGRGLGGAVGKMLLAALVMSPAVVYTRRWLGIEEAKALLGMLHRRGAR